MLELSYEVLGPAPDAAGTPPVVLLHAFPLDATMWTQVASGLPGESCVLIDLPGAGRSPLPPGEPSLRASADGVLAVFDRLGVERAVLAGVSMGGYVALQVARSAPQRLAALALIDTKAEADAPQARENRLRTAEKVLSEGTGVLAPMTQTLLGSSTRQERLDVVADVERRIAAARPDGVAWSQRAMAARDDTTDVVRALRVPVTVVVGEEDVPTPPAAAAALAASLRDGVLVPIPGCGHLSPLEAPGAVATALVGLLLRA